MGSAQIVSESGVQYKLVCLDVDGTLGEPKSGGDFREAADDWEFFPGRVEDCLAIVASGTKIITCSNQGGACFPWSKFTEQEITDFLASTARAIGAMASLVACNIMSERALPQYRYDDPRRKPKPGMLLEAIELAGVEASETLMVGDRHEDEDAAKAAGVRFVWAKDFFKD